MNRYLGNRVSTTASGVDAEHSQLRFLTFFLFGEDMRPLFDLLLLERQQPFPPAVSCHWITIPDCLKLPIIHWSRRNVSQFLGIWLHFRESLFDDAE
jgi:hypothetical protein